MKALIATAACLLAGAAWAQQKVTPVVVTNPSLTVQAADAGRYTHVGQKPSRIVELGMLSHLGGVGHLVDPAIGDVDQTAPFTVPDGFQFILTDISGVSTCSSPGSTFIYGVLQFIDTLPGQHVRTQFNVICSSEGSASFERHYTTGLIIGAGNLIRVSGLGSSSLVRIQGYLVPPS